MSILRRGIFGWIVVLAICFTPVVLWFMVPVQRFADFTGGMANVGQLLALVGSAMFAMDLILSARFRFIDKIFFGLDKVYLSHEWLGQWALIFLLFHPLFLIPKYSAGLAGAASFLWIGSYWPKNWGVISLGLLILLIIFTLYLRPKYNIWKWTHKFMGFAFFLASLHIWFIPSDTSVYLPLRVYMLSLAGIALLSFAYYVLFNKILVSKYKYIVSAKNLLNGSAVEIIMEPKDRPMKFASGQFMFVSFSDKATGGESHPFSITSGEGEGRVGFIAKILGDYTERLRNVSVGSEAKIEGPFGAFSYKKSKYKNQIWVAGGIGITPFLSMAKSLKKEDGYKIDLYYCVKNETEAVYLNLLRNISMFLNNDFRVFTVYSEEGVRIDADYIQKTSGRLSVGNDIFLCAPLVMIEALRKQFAAKGIPKGLIHSEEFNF